MTIVGLKLREMLFLAAMTLAVPGHAQTITTPRTVATLYKFTGAEDGGTPVGTLLQGPDGDFYGTTSNGGAIGPTIFKITAAGKLTTLYRFDATNALSSNCGLTLGKDSNFYGSFDTAVTGGPGFVTFFRMTPAGTLTTLYTFESADSASSLVLSTDGDFYGTTTGGGTGNGTVFRITPQGAFTKLHDFSGPFEPGGSLPEAALVQGPDGNFYGTTSYGGPGNWGTVFKITPEGAFATLHTFTGPNGDGMTPLGALVFGNDGNLYGTTYSGGMVAGGFGTIFQISPSGAFKMIYAFDGFDGQNISAGLTLGKDGNFFGVSAYGGEFDSGTAFEITPAGEFTSLYSFNDSYSPAAALALASDGSFYGITDGPNYTGTGTGTVFKLGISRHRSQRGKSPQ